jgi:hypothetical protein
MREQIWKFTNFVLLISTAIFLLYPAFVDNKTFTEIAISLFQPSLTIEYISRVLVAFILIGSLYVAIVGTIYRKIPVTSISTDLEIKFLDASGKHVQLARTQILRANQRDVKAYFTTHTPTADIGTIQDIGASTYCVSGDLKDSCNWHFKKGMLEVMHVFDEALPYNWFIPVIPVWALSFSYDSLPRFLKKYLIKREFHLTYVDEFNIPKPYAEFEAGPYTLHNFKVTINFSATNLPPQNAIKGMRIKNHAVVALHPDYRPTEKKVVFTLDKLSGERLRIEWLNSAISPPV